MRNEHGLYPLHLDWLSYICSFWLFFYGLAKIVGNQLKLPASMAHQPIEALSGHWLTWYYYGFSPTYKFILGAIQIVAASMLLYRKSTLLAAAMVAPMMANIVMINLFYSISRGAEIMSIFIFGSMLLILGHEARPLWAVLWKNQPQEPTDSRRQHRLIRACVLGAVVVQVVVGVTMLYLQNRRHG